MADRNHTCLGHDRYYCQDHNHNHLDMKDEQYRRRRFKSVLAPVTGSTGDSHDHSAERLLFDMPWEKSLFVILYHIQRCKLLAREGDYERACYFLKRAQVHSEYTFPETQLGRQTMSILLRTGLCACASSALRAKKWLDAERYSSDGILINNEVQQGDVRQCDKILTTSDVSNASTRIYHDTIYEKIFREEEYLEVTLGHKPFNKDYYINVSTLTLCVSCALSEIRLLAIRGTARSKKAEFELSEGDFNKALDVVKLYTTSLSTLCDIEKITHPIDHERQNLKEQILDYKVKEAQMARKMILGSSG
jgi:hypothetical protein